MSLLTGSTFNELHSLYQLYMSKRAAKAVLSHMAHIERNRGYIGLFNEIQRNIVMLETLITQSRGRAISQVHSGKGPLKGQWIHFLHIALRRGAKGGLALAINLLDIRGYFIHPEPSEQEYKDRSLELSAKANPFSGTTDFTITDSIIERMDGLLAGNRLDWLTSWANDTLSYNFDLPYPFNKKNVLITATKRLPGYAVTPDDLLESLWLFPSLVFDEYELFHHIIGDRLPTREKFAGNPSDADIGGTWSLLTKDRRMKLRGVYPFTYILQFVCHALRMVLKEMLKKHPSSYIEDQAAGVKAVYNKLSTGIAQSSVDVTSASDNISLDIQIRLLHLSLPKGPWKEALIRVFERACRMRLLSPYKGVEARHFLGGPMGLEGVYDSFSWLLVWLFSQRFELSSFVMVGDDIVFDAEHDNVVRSLFDAVGIPISEKKSVWNSLDKAEFCGRLITKNGLLGTYKADRVNYSNPLPSFLRYGKAVLSLVPGLASKDRKALTYLPLLEKKLPILDAVTFRYRDFTIELGGYSPTQLFRMGLLTNKQYFVMRYLIALIHSKVKMPPKEFLALEIKREYRSKKTGKTESYTIKVKDQVSLGGSLPREDYLSNPDHKGLWLVDLRDIFYTWVHLLHLDVQGELLIKPGRNSLGSVLFSRMLTGIQGDYKEKGIPFSYEPNPILYEEDVRARDHLKTIASILLSEKDKEGTPGSMVCIDRRLIDIDPLESDLLKSKSAFEQLQLAYKHVLSQLTGSFSSLGRWLLRGFFRSN